MSSTAALEPNPATAPDAGAVRLTVGTGVLRDDAAYTITDMREVDGDTLVTLTALPPSRVGHEEPVQFVHSWRDFVYVSALRVWICKTDRG